MKATYAVNKHTKEHRIVSNPSGLDCTWNEDWRQVLADADGWIEWPGGECPVDPRQRVDIRHRNGHVNHDVEAAMFLWGAHDSNGCIIAYRPVLGGQRAAPEPPEMPPVQQQDITTVRGVVLDDLKLPPTAPEPHATSGIEQALSDVGHPYHELADVLEQAFQQASAGKGKERHANDLPFGQQRMQTIARGQGHTGGLTYQVCKKAQEAEQLPREAALRELLGVIVYASGAFIYRKGDE